MATKKAATPRTTDVQDGSLEAVDAFLQEMQDVEARKASMIQQLLAARSEMVAEVDRKLALLGYSASTGSSAARTSVPRAKQSRKSTSDKICPICSKAHGRDIYGHDGRTHRNHKQPFSDEELAEMAAAA